MAALEPDPADKARKLNAEHGATDTPVLDPALQQTLGSERHQVGHIVSRNRNVYFPEIDGLRTIAVASVVAFHLSPRLFGGGFIGVDIFFVISGYLITGLLINDFSRSDSGTVLGFYQRRIARIAPASFVVVAITTLTASLLYSAQDFASLGANGLAATLSFINLKLLFQGTYFTISPDAQPLMHYWSLAVEEQFYLFFPILLYSVIRLKLHVLPIVLACFALSFGACVVVTPLAPTAAFYLLPTRAWELLAGSILAIAKYQYPGYFAARRLSFALPVGLLILLLSFAFVTNEGFPGWIAALPVIASTLTLAGAGPIQGGTNRFLAHPLMVFIGKRSYSLYLWHWPTFSFIDYYFYFDGAIVRVPLKVLAIMILTILTYHFVELPLRILLNIPRNRTKAFVAFAASATLLSVVGYTIRASNYLSAEARDVPKGGISVNPGGHGWIVLIGDSQGAMYGYELASLARALHFRLNVLSVAGRNELPGEADTLWSSVIDFLGDRRPDAVVLAQAWSSKLSAGGEEHLRSALSTLLSKTSQVFVLTQPPAPPSDATRESMRAGARPPFFESPPATDRRLRANAILQSLGNTQVRILDVAPIFLESDNSIRVVALNGRTTFQDDSHLSDAGTALVRPMLGKLLQEILIGRNASREQGST